MFKKQRVEPGGGCVGILATIQHGSDELRFGFPYLVTTLFDVPGQCDINGSGAIGIYNQLSDDALHGVCKWSETGL